MRTPPLPADYLCQGLQTNLRKTLDTTFAYYLAGASLGKVADLLFEKGVLSPTGNERWTRAAIDKLLSNAKYIPIVGFEIYTDVQFEKERRCNIDYDRAGNPRKTIRYQSPDMTM